MQWSVLYLLTFQLLVSPVRLTGLLSPRKELWEKSILVASFSFTSDRITLPLLAFRPQPNPIVKSGLKQKTKNVSHRLSPVEDLQDTRSLSSQHRNGHPSSSQWKLRWLGLRKLLVRACKKCSPSTKRNCDTNITFSNNRLNTVII